MPTFRITLVQLMYGQECQNVFHLSGPSTDPAELSALADHVFANWVSNVRQMQTSSVTYTAVKVRMLESQFPTFIKTVNQAGANGPDTELSTVLAWILRLRANEIGRAGRGRMYIPGVMKGWTENGLVTQTMIVSWNNRIANLLGIYGPGGSSNYRLEICPSKPPFNNTSVTSMQIGPKLGTQRRRNIGVGI